MAGSKSRPRISVVVPTRERAHTLPATLSTCVTQSYRELEIVVHDNASGPATAEAVAKFDDKRLKYFRSGERLSMRANFEAALNRATGDYVVFIGDDDALAVEGISRLAELLVETGAEVVKWALPHYIWPDRAVAGAGYLTLKAPKLFWDYSTYDGPATLDLMCAANVRNYMHGPDIYHGCVARSVIDRIKPKTGPYFAYTIPDVYATVANLFVVGTILHVRHPLSITGHSASSTGMSFSETRSADGEVPTETPYGRFVDETRADTEAQPYNPHIRAINYHTLICLHVANELLGARRQINVEGWIDKAVAETVADPQFLAEAHRAEVVWAYDKQLLDRLPPPPKEAASRQRSRVESHGRRRSLRKLDVPTAIDGRDDAWAAAQTLDRLTSTGYRIAPRGALSPARHLWHWAQLRRKALPLFG
jgi:Glycosyl transferase family 2